MLNLVSDIPSQWKAFKPADAITVQATHDSVRQKRDGRSQPYHDVRGVDLSKFTAQQTDSALTLVSSHGETKITVREHAFSQLCTQLGAPARYLRQLPTETALQCLNHGLRKYEGTPRTLRMAGSSVRAIVSDRYAELDDVPALHMLAEACGGRELFLAGFGQSVGTTVCRFVSPKLFDGPDGHPLQIGLDFKNSEVGNHSVSLRSVIFRQVCTNGLVVEYGKSQASKWRHIGNTERLQDAFASMVPVVLSGAEEALYRAAASHGLILSVAEARARVAALQLTEGQQELSLTAALSEAGLAANAADDAKITGWHLINGMTASARDLEPAERVFVEAQAGRILAAA